MSKDEYTYADFIKNAGNGHEVFFNQINEFLMSNGFVSKIELKKTGYAASYMNKNNKRILMNYVTRKKGIFVRIYGDNAIEYPQVLDSLPDSMKKEILKGAECKRMLDDSACNSRCKKGINMVLDGKFYGKCRFSALMFLVDPEKYDHIRSLIENEVKYI